MATQVLFITWLLTDEHDSCMARSFAGDGLRRVLPQIASPALLQVAGDLLRIYVGLRGHIFKVARPRDAVSINKHPALTWDNHYKDEISSEISI
jgi:hypothetical protein